MIGSVGLTWLIHWIYLTMFECRVCINYVHVTHYGEVTSDHAPITSPPPRSNCQILVKVKFVWGGECYRLSGHFGYFGYFQGG